MDPVSDPSASPTSAPAAHAVYASAQLANVAAAVRGLEHPTQIGPYAIQTLIGEGGMGSIYRAEQRTPIHRIVALKLVKLGMDTRDVIARFESERQALALMDHPNVAKVLDAGATDAGRPYFVMEYVRGEPITNYADRHRLTLRQRLELFTQACDAIQHAHQKAIIHRDLKPSNILVTESDGKPLVKVIDFGVAKAISQRLTERTFFTETGQLIGTPEYMAPEQAEASVEDVDTRSDVYSLGVILYELLSGALPFDPKTLRSRGYNEIQRIIRETDPPRPSTRLSKLGREAEEVARLRQTPLDTLERLLKGELEWIPLKAMQKERPRRYASAAELAQDIDSYLHNRPLRAVPDSTTYRLRKFLRRNKTGVAASAAMVFLLVAGIAATTWQAVRATRAEHDARAALRQAKDAADEAREVNRFLTDDLLASASPEVTRGREMTVREALDRAASSIAKRFLERPLTEAAVRSALADTYDALGLFPRALEHAQAALELTRAARGADDEQTLSASATVGKALAKLNRHVEAEPMLRDAVTRAQQRFGPDHEVTIKCVNSLATTLRMQEKFAEAEPLYRRVLETDRRVYGTRSKETAQSLNNLAVLLNTQGRSSEAEPLYRESLETRAALLGEDHPSYLGTLANLARVLGNQGKFADSEAMERRALAGKLRVLGPDHPATLLTMNDLAGVLADQKKFEECAAIHREALERRTRVLGPDDPDTLQSMSNLGVALLRLGHPEEAEGLLKQAYEKRRTVLGETHVYTLGTLTNLAAAYTEQRKFAEAEPLFARACEPEVMAKLAPDMQARALTRYGTVLARLGKFAEAEPVLLDVRKRLRAGSAPPDVRAPLLGALAEVYQQLGRGGEADEVRAELTALAAATTRTTTQPATTKP